MILVIVLLEFGLRQLGLVDFPLYDADAEIGYIPKANQRGSFMNRNDWQVNELHMGNGPFKPSPQGNILLVGDSIVWGGNPYAAHERLGPQLQALVPQAVWTVAAGSWALQNELTYLNQHPEVVQAVQQLVVVSNNGDFSRPSSWTCEVTHPRQAPALALGYLARKYALKEACPASPPVGYQVAAQDVWEMLRRFTSAHPRLPVTVFLYPDKAECERPGLRVQQLDSLAPKLLAHGVGKVYSVASSSAWADCQRLYKDGIHPTPPAMQSLAGIIATNMTDQGQ